MIATSEGARQQAINVAEGERQAFIARSEGQKQAAINNAQGEAAAIEAVADATAHALEVVANAIQKPGGAEAVQLKVAQQGLDTYANLAKSSTTLIVPGDMSQAAGLIASAMTVLKKTQ